MKKNVLKGIQLNRTIGIEVEGYTGSFMSMLNNRVRHSDLKRDGSLTGGGSKRGIEVVTVPINKLDLLDEVFEDIAKYNWSVGRGTAGTHVHVDASDFFLEDRIKMAIFMQQIEKAMFLMVKKYRWSRRGYERNRYCLPISLGWKRLLERLNQLEGVDWRQYRKLGELQHRLAMLGKPYLPTPDTSRYQFINIWSSSKPTVEFRIFHAIRSPKDAKMFALLSYHLVELVKNSTLEHLEYLANEIMVHSTSANDMVERLSQAIGLDFVPKIHNKQLEVSINNAKQVRRTVAV